MDMGTTCEHLISPANKRERFEPRAPSSTFPCALARAFSDTHAVRLFRRMTQGDDENDKMASHIAKNYMTQRRPVKTNGWIANRDRRTLLVPTATGDKNQHPTDKSRLLSKQSGERTANTPYSEPRTRGNESTAPRSRTRPWQTSASTARKTNSRSELDCGTNTCSHQTGIALDRPCERCGSTRIDTNHRFWECTALKSTYDEDASLFQDFRSCKAPACLTTCGFALECRRRHGCRWDRQCNARSRPKRKKYDEWEQIQLWKGKTARQVLVDYSRHPTSPNTKRKRTPTAIQYLFHHFVSLPRFGSAIWREFNCCTTSFLSVLTSLFTRTYSMHD